ncbi:MAG TPA: prolyl oligopeptidase family serine peptidase [Steroidobacteraceae bacterium]|nr:prolyl oligopeptidase family serine peptidase [Steroidobacteraceae bacterium]
MPHRPSKLLSPLVLLVGMVSAAAPCHARETAQFTMTQVLGYPFPSELVALRSGGAFAWVSDARGERSIWVAQAPDYRARKVADYAGDTGQEISYLQFSHDGKYVIYVLGGDHDANWPVAAEPDPAASPGQPHMQVWAVSLSGGEPRALGEGDAPVVSPDNRLAFIHMPERSVWQAPLDGSSKAQRLFFDLGRNSDLRWSPDGKSLAFVSDRGDHSFIGVYRDADTPIEYLLPSTSQDVEPRWSPDGRRIAFVRTPGDGGPPQSILQWHPIQWSIWVADVARNTGTRVWESPNTLRGSYPEDGSGLLWAAGNRLAFMSEVDNWPHLYAVSAAGGEAKLLTPGPFMVEDVAMTPDRHDLIYNANTGSTPGDEDRRHLYRVSVDGGAPVAITRGSHSAWNPVSTGGGATLAFIDAGPRHPPQVMWGNLTGADWHSAGGDALPPDFPTKDLVVPKAVTFRAADGLAIEGQVFAAPGGSARKPGIIFVHGGPPRQMLLTWSYMGYYSNDYAVNQYLANHGFVVLSVNYRLGIGYGHDFQYPGHWGPTGASEYQDVVAGAKWLQQDRAVDPDRIGIWGGSYGGYLTALGLARNSDIFKAGVDWHGVHDWSILGDDWFGNTIDRYQMLDMAALKRIFWLSSPDSAIGTWKSPVLLIQGDDDRNVRFHQMVDLVRRLQLQHVPYEELVIPDEIHGFLRWHSDAKADEATAAFFDKQLLHRSH